MHFLQRGSSTQYLEASCPSCLACYAAASSSAAFGLDKFRSSAWQPPLLPDLLSLHPPFGFLSASFELNGVVWCQVVVVHALDTCDFFARRGEAQQFGFVGAISVPVFSDDGRDVVAVAVTLPASFRLQLTSCLWPTLTYIKQRFDQISQSHLLLLNIPHAQAAGP